MCFKRNNICVTSIKPLHHTILTLLLLVLSPVSSIYHEVTVLEDPPLLIQPYNLGDMEGARGPLML
jgi:hypothetical protein